jgi:manganese-dependent inorganic pyrophosphatase
MAEALAADLGIDDPDYAAEMFAAKSDVSAFSDAELLRMDSKEYEVGGTKFRVSVLETTSPETRAGPQGQPDGHHADRGLRGRRRSGAAVRGRHPARGSHAAGAERSGETVAEKSFATVVGDDTVVLPGVMSRKKQIIPNLAL